MKRICLMICAIVMICVCVACGGDSSASKAEKKLIGTWVYDSKESDISTNATKLTFFEGGGLANTGESGTWSVSGSTVSVLGTYGGQFFSHDNIIGEFKVKGEKLIISNPAVDGNVKKGDLVYIKYE